MGKGLALWGIWLLCLVTGTYGMGILSDAIVKGRLIQVTFGLSVLIFGFWVSINILASAKNAHRKRHQRSGR